MIVWMYQHLLVLTQETVLDSLHRYNCISKIVKQDCLATSMVTWECSPAAYINNCSGATQQLPYPLVNNATTAMDYIANSIKWVTTK